jgi:hypothetical protein
MSAPTPDLTLVVQTPKDTGAFQERRLEHREEAEEIDHDLGAQGLRVRVGMEASGHDYSRNCSLSCGSGMPPRLAQSGCASSRRIARMRS